LASFDVNVNWAVVELVGEDGYPVRLAIGGVVSIVQAYVVGFPSKPWESVA
jgi:hypothetical protein